MPSHTPEFVQEMKSKLLQEKEELERELKAIANVHDGDFQGKFPDYGRSDEDNAAEVADYQDRSATTEAAEVRLKEVLAALERIEQGTYGVTEQGELIPEERLRANPAATTLIRPS